MKIDDNHYVNYTNETVVDKKRRRKSSRIIFTETKGAYTSKRIVKSKEKRFTSDIVGFCFVMSLILLLGSLFFGGGFNSVIISTEVNQTISNNINGVDYDYNINYVNYDYSQKLNQLQSLRNVFTLDDFVNEESEIDLLRVPNPEFFMEGAKYHDDSYIIGKMIDEGVVTITPGRFEIDGQGYSYYYLHLDTLFVPKEYKMVYNNYVNSNNVVSWVDYQMRLINEGDMWYDDIVYAFKVIHAPIIWIANFLYDLGVLVAFIVVWQVII